MRPGRSSNPTIAAPVSDLPAPDSPTTPRISPASMLNDTRSKRPQHAAPRGKFDGQVLDFQQRHQRSLGFSASRSQSPSRLIASTISDQREAGKHRDPPLAGEQEVVAEPDQRARATAASAAARRRGRTSVASVMIARPRPSVPITMTGPMTLGSTWLSMIRQDGTPITRAAMT